MDLLYISIVILIHMIPANCQIEQTAYTSVGVALTQCACNIKIPNLLGLSYFNSRWHK